MSRSTLLWSCLLVLTCITVAWAGSFDPGASDYSGHKGVTIHVSSRGDNSDGRSWATAFHTIQAALLAVPDGEGGHRVVVAPGTYAEANLYPSFKGAPGSYNLLIGDTEGAYGSGQTGRVVIDSGAPAVMVRNSYFANLDWWGDAGAVYVRGEDSSMPDVPHATFENCTLMGYQVFGAAMENTPFIYRGMPYLALNHRNDARDRIGDYASEENMHLYIQNLNTGVRVARFGAGHSFVSAFVDGDILRIFASQGTNDDWFKTIYQFTTTDMQHWTRKLAIPLEGPGFMGEGPGPDLHGGEQRVFRLSRAAIFRALLLCDLSSRGHPGSQRVDPLPGAIQGFDRVGPPGERSASRCTTGPCTSSTRATSPKEPRRSES